MVDRGPPGSKGRKRSPSPHLSDQVPPGRVARLQAIVDSALDAVITMDEKGSVVDWNPQAERIFGWRRKDILGRALADTIVPPQHRQAHTRGIKRYLETGDGPVLGQVLELTAMRRNGEEFAVELSISPAWNSRNKHLFIAFARDISDRKRQAALKSMQFAVTRTMSVAADADTALASVLAAIGDALNFEAANVWLLEGTPPALRCSVNWAVPGSRLGQFQSLSGKHTMSIGEGLPGSVVATGEAIAVTDVANLANFPRRDAARETGLHGAFAFPLLIGASVSGVMEFFTTQHRTLNADELEVLSDVGGQIGQFLERVSATTALQASRDRLADIAATDALTGLRNRREFERMLVTIPRRSFGILAIDVDHLKRINDEYGHEAGDVVLRAVALTLSSLARGWDLVARVGGDEFGVVLQDTDEREVQGVAERMCSAIHSISVAFGQARISIGWAIGPAGADPYSIWRAADGHLFMAKRAGRDRVSGGMSAAGEANPGSGWAEMVERALATREIHTMYQPVVRLGDGSVLGHEALSRPPGCGPRDSVALFFAAAQRMGRMRDIDWLCRRLAVERVPWQANGGLDLFVNVSAIALLDAVHEVDQMLLLLRSVGGRPDQIVLEITETEIIADLDRLHYVLAAYREHGFRFALDDIGDGHSTLEVLAAAKPEFLKIARSLTVTAMRSGSRAAIRAAVSFAQDTGATVLAEGVETEVAAAQMASMGTTLGQGFILGDPMPPEKAFAAVARLAGAAQ